MMNSLIWFLLVTLAIAVLYFTWKILQDQRIHRLPSRGLQRQNAIRCVRSSNMNSSSTSLWFPADPLRFMNPPPAYEGTHDPPPKYEEVMNNQSLSFQNQQPIERIA